MAKRLLWIICVISVTRVSAQCRLSPESMKADFTILRDTLERDHPGLYRYRTKEDVDRMFDSCLVALQDTMTEGRFYRLVCYAIAFIEDGHTNCRLPRGVIKGMTVFPAQLVFLESGTYIFDCPQDSSLDGMRVMSINGQPAREIVGDLCRYIPSDGGVRSHEFSELPEMFPLVYDARDSFSLTLRTSGGLIRTATLYPDSIKNLGKRRLFQRPERYLTLTYEPDGAALLKIGTFFDGFLQQTRENFGLFLDSAFKDIRQKGVRKLLIDVRGNQGGNDGNGELLYAYLTAKPFRYYKSQETVKEIFDESTHPNLALQDPRPGHFDGAVYILTDGRSFSATAEFVAIAKTNHRAKFIGEECGGGYYGDTSGDDMTLTLPNSGINCRIPLVKYTMAVDSLPKGKYGVLPDYPVARTIDDVMEGTDSQLKYALNLMVH